MTIIPCAQRCQLWGSLVSCGRLSIGLTRVPGKTAAVANRRAGCHPAPNDLNNRQYFGRTTLAAGISGLQKMRNRIGANMAADVLEDAGRNVEFLGAAAPHSGIIEAVQPQNS
jgi:hypothetical protein